MNGYIQNIEEQTKQNSDYRRVLYTTKDMQLVLMCLQPGEEIGAEVHELTQFIRIESGQATVTLGETEHAVGDDWAFVVPAGMNHNVINTGDTPLKLYSLYAPPEHKDGLVQPTKADDAEVHFDGTTTE